MGQHVLAYFLGRNVGRLVRRLQEREHDNRLVALKLLFSRLGNNLLGGEIHAIQLLDRISGSLSQYLINRHNILYSYLSVIDKKHR